MLPTREAPEPAPAKSEHTERLLAFCMTFAAMPRDAGGYACFERVYSHARIACQQTGFTMSFAPLGVRRMPDGATLLTVSTSIANSAGGTLACQTEVVIPRADTDFDGYRAAFDEARRLALMGLLGLREEIREDERLPEPTEPRGVAPTDRIQAAPVAADDHEEPARNLAQDERRRAPNFER